MVDTGASRPKADLVQNLEVTLLKSFSEVKNKMKQELKPQPRFGSHDWFKTLPKPDREWMIKLSRYDVGYSDDCKCKLCKTHPARKKLQEKLKTERTNNFGRECKSKINYEEL